MKDIFGIVRLDVAETAQMLRDALKEAFPGVRFSVRCKRRVSWDTITVEYGGGPAAGKVERVTTQFIGRGPLRDDPFEGLTTSRYVRIDGQTCKHGVDEIYVERYDRIVEGTVTKAIAPPLERQIIP